MKAVDAVIVAIGVVALGLAGMVIMRSREASRPATERVVPSAQAPAPSDAAFPACQSEPAGTPRWRCQVDQARKQNRIRCYGQRLFYVSRDANGHVTYNPWPAQLQCWNQGS